MKNFFILIVLPMQQIMREPFIKKTIGATSKDVDKISQSE
jgi:hypothetical protein